MSDINRSIFRRLLPLAAAGLCLLSLIPVAALPLSDAGALPGGALRPDSTLPRQPRHEAAGGAGAP